MAAWSLMFVLLCHLLSTGQAGALLSNTAQMAQFCTAVHPTYLHQPRQLARRLSSESFGICGMGPSMSELRRAIRLTAGERNH